MTCIPNSHQCFLYHNLSHQLPFIYLKILALDKIKLPKQMYVPSSPRLYPWKEEEEKQHTIHHNSKKMKCKNALLFMVHNIACTISISNSEEKCHPIPQKSKFPKQLLLHKIYEKTFNPKANWNIYLHPEMYKGITGHIKLRLGLTFILR